jgi:hypothetical protein
MQLRRFFSEKVNVSIRISRLVFTFACASGIFATGASALAAQTRPDVDGRRLRLATDTLMVTEIERDTERAGGLAISTLRALTPDELEMTYRWRPSIGDSAVIVARLERRSLRPLSEERRYADGSAVHLAYGPWGVRAETVHPSRGRQQHSPDSTGRSAHPSTTVDLVLRALPLATGYRAEVPVHFPAGIGRWPLSVRVVGTETVRTRRGVSVDCWVVEADFPGPATERFWIAKDTRDLIRVLAHSGPNVLQCYER